MSDFKIPKPNFTGTYPSFSDYFGCGCFNQPKEKTDCYFYTDVQDMGAHIPTCNYHDKLGYCPCENCEKYINGKEVFEMVKNHVDELGEELKNCEKQKRIVSMKNAGWSIEKIADEMGMEPQSVSDALNQYKKKHLEIT